MTLAVSVLGCATPFPRPGEPCSGYLVRTPAARLLIDCGSGTFAALQQHITLDELTGLWISHLHPDHSADLLAVFNWLINTPDVQGLPAYGPPGWSQRLAAMLPSPEAARSVHQAFEVHEHHDGQQTDFSGLRLQSFAVDHTVPTYGLRMEHEGHTIAYSADTAPCPALARLAEDADLFICEAGTSHTSPGHCTPQDAGRTARDARARRLLITHVPQPGQRQHAADTAADIFGFPVEVAQPATTFTIGG